MAEVVYILIVLVVGAAGLLLRDGRKSRKQAVAELRKGNQRFPVYESFEDMKADRIAKAMEEDEDG